MRAVSQLILMVVILVSCEQETRGRIIGSKAEPGLRPVIVGHVQDQKKRAVKSASDACPVKFERVGCYKDNQKKRPLPELLLTDRDPSSHKYSGHSIDWKNWNQYLRDSACRCAKKVKRKGYPVFGLQAYGECWSGANGEATYAKDGTSESCITYGYAKCSQSSRDCVGKTNINFVYRIKKESPKPTIPRSTTTVKPNPLSQSTPSSPKPSRPRPSSPKPSSPRSSSPKPSSPRPSSPKPSSPRPNSPKPSRPRPSSPKPSSPRPSSPKPSSPRPGSPKPSSPRPSSPKPSSPRPSSPEPTPPGCTGPKPTPFPPVLTEDQLINLQCDRYIIGIYFEEYIVEEALDERSCKFAELEAKQDYQIADIYRDYKEFNGVRLKSIKKATAPTHRTLLSQSAGNRGLNGYSSPVNWYENWNHVTCGWKATSTGFPQISSSQEGARAKLCSKKAKTSQPRKQHLLSFFDLRFSTKGPHLKKLVDKIGVGNIASCGCYNNAGEMCQALTPLSCSSPYMFMCCGTDAQNQAYSVPPQSQCPGTCP